MPTRKLYYEDAHQSAFRAVVTACRQSDKGYEITLDATCFYPEGGGQAADTGTLDSVHVLHTREDGAEIVHLCDAPLAVGQTVTGQIDWASRFLRMQLHSGEHIVSGILHRRYGVNNTGFHMGAARTVIDFDGVIPSEALPGIEQEANHAVWQNIPLHIWYPSPEELPAVPYRSKKALPWPVRIVEIPGFDTCACCGTHVTATGEIGLIKLYSSVPFRPRRTGRLRRRKLQRPAGRSKIPCGGIAAEAFPSDRQGICRAGQRPALRAGAGQHRHPGADRLHHAAVRRHGGSVFRYGQRGLRLLPGKCR